MPDEAQRGDASFTSLFGQSLSYADLQLTGTVSMVAVVFHPFGARAFFDMPISEVSDLIVSADDPASHSS